MADGLIQYDCSFLAQLVRFLHINAIFLFALAEALHHSFEMSWELLLFVLSIDSILADGVDSPVFMPAFEVVFKLLAFNLRILELLSKRSLLTEKDNRK